MRAIRQTGHYSSIHSVVVVVVVLLKPERRRFESWPGGVLGRLFSFFLSSLIIHRATKVARGAQSVNASYMYMMYMYVWH